MGRTFVAITIYCIPWIAFWVSMPRTNPWIVMMTGGLFGLVLGQLWDQFALHQRLSLTLWRFAVWLYPSNTVPGWRHEKTTYVSLERCELHVVSTPNQDPGRGVEVRLERDDAPEGDHSNGPAVNHPVQRKAAIRHIHRRE